MSKEAPRPRKDKRKEKLGPQGGGGGLSSRYKWYCVIVLCLLHSKFKVGNSMLMPKVKHFLLSQNSPFILKRDWLQVYRDTKVILGWQTFSAAADLAPLVNLGFSWWVLLDSKVALIARGILWNLQLGLCIGSEPWDIPCIALQAGVRGRFNFGEGSHISFERDWNCFIVAKEKEANVFPGLLFSSMQAFSNKPSGLCWLSQIPTFGWCDLVNLQLDIKWAYLLLWWQLKFQGSKALSIRDWRRKGRKLAPSAEISSLAFKPWDLLMQAIHYTSIRRNDRWWRDTGLLQWEFATKRVLNNDAAEADSLISYQTTSPLGGHLHSHWAHKQGLSW